jgi:hypothetical protein
VVCCPGWLAAAQAVTQQTAPKASRHLQQQQQRGAGDVTARTVVGTSSDVYLVLPAQWLIKVATITNDYI